jgi:DNA-binding NarL/FixJ family response regulator
MGYIPKTAPATEVRHALTMILLGRIYLPLHLFNNNRQEAGEEFSPPQPGAVSVVAIVPEEIHDLSLPLTERQLEVLRYLEQGMSNKEIAMAILCAENTIKNHVAAIFRALGVHSRIKALEAVRRMRLGLPGGKL